MAWSAVADSVAGVAWRGGEGVVEGVTEAGSFRHDGDVLS